jgi:hypothetical protein
MFPLHPVFDLASGIQVKEYSAPRSSVRGRFARPQFAKIMIQIFRGKDGLLRSGFVRALSQGPSGSIRSVALHAIFLGSLFWQRGRRSEVLRKAQDAHVWDFPAKGLRLASHGEPFFQENRLAGVGGEGACSGQDNVPRPILHLNAPPE